jgi:hypothetical protein
MNTATRNETTVKKSYYVIRHTPSGKFVGLDEMHNEFFLTDTVPVTNDFREPYQVWQGDKASGQRTYGAGPQKTFCDEVRHIIDRLDQSQFPDGVSDLNYSDFELLTVQAIYEIVGEPIIVE